MRRLRFLLAALAAASVLAFGTCECARADDTSACVPIAVAICPSVAFGEFFLNSNGSSTGIVASASIPHIPLPYIPQIAVALPFRGSGRYALTGELRTYGRLYGGVGAGTGNLDGVGLGGFTLDALGGLQIVPNLSVVGRYYFGGHSGSGNSGFVGVRLGF
jgi:hypothetical protein